jgi:glucuronate isomerase
MMLNEDGLFPAEPTTRAIARGHYFSICGLPIISPHGHTNLRWFAENEAYPDPAQLFVVPDHCVFCMLYSQCVPLKQLAIGSASREDSKRVWRIFAQHYSLFRGTPTRLCLDFTFQERFGIGVPRAT